MPHETSNRVDVGIGIGIGIGGPSTSTSFTKSGDRLRFPVELRPGETTIVSWKKLTNKASGSASAREPLSSPLLWDPRIPPQALFHNGTPTEAELKDEPPSNRFSAFIENIERTYKDNDCSDEVDDVPDNDQYDIEDSFIDDAKLMTIFKLTTVQPNITSLINESWRQLFSFYQQERVAFVACSATEEKANNGHPKALGDEGPLRKKDAKVVEVSKDATMPTFGKITSFSSETCAAVGEHFEDGKHQNQIKKRSVDSTKIDHALSSKASNGVALVVQAENKAVLDKQANEHQSKSPITRVKDANRHLDPPHQKSERSQSESQSERNLNNVDVLVQPIKRKTKRGICDMKGTHLPDGKHAYAANTHRVHKKDGSNVKTNALMLEKAIKELERMVAESRLPAMEFQDSDMSGQAVKRRLPREIKQKLANVARLVQANYGEVSEEVVNYLMGFLGHTMQLRTLKRNLRMMISSGLIAKQEKDFLFQQIKREVTEIITKEFEQQARMPSNFQEYGSERKGASKTKYAMSVVLEDKICDLYDLYVDGLEEDSGSQIRKLYAELAQLWPTGSMDNHGIKCAICRSKYRKRALHMQQKKKKDSKLIIKKKALTLKTVDKQKL